MKTFLHYTKERELDESIFGTAGRFVKKVRNNPFMGLLGKNAGGKELGDALVGQADAEEEEQYLQSFCNKTKDDFDDEWTLAQKQAQDVMARASSKGTPYAPDQEAAYMRSIKKRHDQKVAEYIKKCKKFAT